MRIVSWGKGTMKGNGKSHYLREASVFIFLVFCFVYSASAQAEHLTASGCSVSNKGYLTALAKEYEKRTGTKVFVRGGGTVLGVEDIRSGKVDFAAACRHRAKGDPADVEFTQVAWDALAFIVHESNPVDGISLGDVRAIYAGKITNWKQLGGPDAPIKIFISRAKKGLSGVESSTRDLVLKGKDPVETRHMIFLASSAIVEQLVAETPEGFATTGFSSARKRNVKMLKVDGVSPTFRNIVNGKYALKRPLFILTPAKPKPEVKRFLEFTLSREGQRFISSQGVVSLYDIRGMHR